MPGFFSVTCRAAYGYNRDNMVWVAHREAAIAAVYGEYPEFLAGNKVETPQGFVRVYFVLGGQDTMDYMRSLKVDGRFERPDLILSREDLGYFREAAAVHREDVAYDECRRFMFDVQKAAADPAKGQACANTMAVIDRSRSQRQQAASNSAQQQAAVYQQQQVELMQQQIQMQAAENVRQRRREAMIDLAKALQRPAPVVVTPTHTTCNTYGSTMSCNSY